MFKICYILFTLMFFATPVFANPLVASSEAELILSFWIFIFTVFLITVLIEFCIANIFLKKYLNKWTAFLKSILIVNTITFPITQILAFFLKDFFYGYGNYNYYFAELFPLIVEFFLLKWQLNKLYNNKILSLKISNKKILIITIVMNLITFALGIFLMKWFY